MGVKFPLDRADKRRFLLQAVATVRDTLAAHAEESETLRTLHEESVAALTDSGLLAMKCPIELGGAEADIFKSHLQIVNDQALIAEIAPASYSLVLNDSAATSL